MTTPIASAPLSEARFLKSDDVMRLLAYTDRSAFWQAIKAAGLPFVKINARRYVFEETAVRAWLNSRTVGSVQS